MKRGAKHLKEFRTAQGSEVGPGSPSSASNARGATRARPSLSSWQAERLRVLRQRCRVIDAARKRGRSVERSCRLLAWYWHKKTFRCDPSRRFRISHQTLRRLYYAWLKSGRSDSALMLHYSNTRYTFKLSRRHVARIKELLCDPRIGSLAEIHRAVFPAGSRRPSLDRFYEKFPAAFRNRSRRFFLARLTHNRAERAFAKAVKEATI
jgi:hypothetical protein